MPTMAELGNRKEVCWAAVQPPHYAFCPSTLLPFNLEFNTNNHAVAAELDDPLDVLLNKCLYEINKRTVKQLPNSGPASTCTHGMLVNTFS